MASTTISTQATYDALKDRVTSIWHELVTERTKRGEWSDQENSPNLTMSCEALESLFLPIQYVPTLKSELVAIYPYEKIREDIESILKDCEQKGFYVPRDYVGDSFTQLEEEEWPQLLDTASFYLTCLLHFRHTFEKELEAEDSDLISSISAGISKALKYIHACKKPQEGWSWTDQDQTFSILYMTHSAVEALRDIFDDEFGHREYLPEDTSKLLDELQQYMEETSEWIEKEFLDEEDESSYMIGKQIQFSSDDSGWYYNLYATLILLETHSENPLVEKSVDSLLKRFTEKSTAAGFKTALDKKTEFYLEGSAKKFFDKDNTASYTDQAGIPYMMKMLILFLNQNPAKAEEYEPYIGVLIKAMDGTRLKGKNLWRKGSFKIYYTERVVEAFSAALGYLNKTAEATAVIPVIPLNIGLLPETKSSLETILGIDTLISRLDILESKVNMLSTSSSNFESDIQEGQAWMQDLESLKTLRVSSPQEFKERCIELKKKYSNNHKIIKTIEEYEALMQDYERIKDMLVSNPQEFKKQCVELKNKYADNKGIIKILDDYIRKS